MQRTIFLAITLLALATHLSWAQTPTIEPAVTPPAPPTAISTTPVVPTIESDKNTELPLLVIEEPKAGGLRIDEFRQIIQLLVNRGIAKLVPSTGLGKLADTHPTIAFTFVPESDRDKIRRVLFEIRQINIPNLRVTIREHSRDEDGHPATEVRIPNYESLGRTQVIALWKLFKQKRLNALFLSGKNNVAYAIPQFPDPVFGDETTEQIKVERGPAAVAYLFVRGTLKNEGPPCGLGYDEQTNTLLLDRRDGVTVQVTDLLDFWQKNYGPAPKTLVASSNAKDTAPYTSKPSETKTEGEPTQAESRGLDKSGVEASAATSDPIASEAAKLVVQLEDERVKLLQDLGDKHPKIEELNARLAKARSQLSPPAVSPAVPEAFALPYMRACVLELKVERDALSKQLGAKHARVMALDSYMAEVEAKIREIETASRAERVKSVSEMKEFLSQMSPEWMAKNRAKRDQLAKDDPTNPQILELEEGLASVIVMQRAYKRAVDAFEAGQESTADILHQTLLEQTFAPADVSEQIAQLRKDYEAAEAEAQRLAEQLRQPGSPASKDELEKTVKEAFKLRQSLLRAELSEMLDRLAKTQHSIDLRDRITDQIVTRRVEELLNPQLEWDRDSSGNTNGDLSQSKSGEAQTSGVTQTIPAGMRVVTIDVDHTQHSPVPSRVHAGDKVDVLVFSGDAGPDVLLEFVTVFDVTSVTSGENAETANQQHVSLLVTPEMAKAVFLAQKRKQVSLSLRSQQDVATSKLNAAAYEKLMTRGEFHAAMLAKLQGTWEAVFSYPGVAKDKSSRVPRNFECVVEARNDTLRFSGITNNAFGEIEDLDIKIRAFGQTQPGMPQGVELTFGSIKEGSPDECPGIIEILDDQVRLCFGETERPTAFEVGTNHATWLLTLKRPSRESQTSISQPEMKSSPIGGLSQADLLAKLQGQWQLTQHVYEEVDTSDGKQPAPDDIKRENWSPETYYRIKKIPMKAMFDGNRVSACMEDGSDQMTFEITFRKAGPPQQVDLTMELSPADLAGLKQMDDETRSSTTLPTFQGIIEETSDGFRLCLDARMKGNRPFLFVLGPDTALWEFHREDSSSPVSAPARVTDEESLPQSESKPAESKSLSPSDTETAQAGQMTAKQLTLLFLAILERRPTDREEEAWLNSMRKGQSVTDVVSILLANSQVFNEVDRDKAGYIKRLHRILMDRAPTAEELTYWTHRYDELKGIRHEFAREFLNSIGESSISELMARQAAVSQPLKPAAEAPAAPAAEPSPKDVTGKKRHALVATRDIPAGYPLTDFDVVMVEIPASIQVPEGGEFVQTPQEYEQRSLRMSVPSGSLIRKSDLGEKGVFNASLQIPKGMRINTFPVTHAQTQSGMLKPDERVDVKVTFTTPKGAIEAKTLLEYVRVFACEDKTVKGENGQPVLRSRFVTLLVTPEQDGYLEIAKTKGQLSLALRNPDDDKLVNPHGLNTTFLDELKHVAGPEKSPPQAAATELDGDWHLLWKDNGEWKSRYAANMTIHGDQYSSSSKQKTGSKGQITIDTKAKTVFWSNMVSTPTMPAEVPPIPSDSRGIYELNEDRLTIRSQDGTDLFVWGRGLCDVRAAKSPPDGMALFPVRDVKSPVDLGQFNPGDKVDVSAEWELPDGSRNTGLVAELVEIDAVMYGDPKVGNAVMLLGTPDQVKLIEAVWSRSKLTLVVRKAGDEGLKLPGGMNASVLTEIQAAAGANPVTPLEGDWYLESQAANGDVMGHRLNMTIRGDVWTQEFLGGESRVDTIRLFGIMKINKNDRSYEVSEWTTRNPPRSKDGVRYPVGENGTFELTDDKLIMKSRDKLIMKSREIHGDAILTRTWKKGHRPLVPPLSSVSETRKLRWRSGIVEIFLGRDDTLGKRLDGVDKGDGMGVVVSPDGLIVGNPRNSAFYFANSDTHTLHAKFDDGSFVKLTLVEDAKNGWLALKPEKEIRVNHFFPIATTPNAIADEVYAWGTNISGGEHFLDVFQSKVLLLDRRLSGTSEPVWQLLKPDHWGRASGLPILSAEGELLALTMPDTGDLLLALPADRLKAMFPKSFPVTIEPQAAPAEAAKPAATP